MGLFLWKKMKERVAIQGYIGSYHHEAANNYLGNDIEIVECDTFKTLAKSLAKGKVEKAIMAIENTICLLYTSPSPRD